jgi:hypothetical protein
MLSGATHSQSNSRGCVAQGSLANTPIGNASRLSCSGARPDPAPISPPVSAPRQTGEDGCGSIHSQAAPVQFQEPKMVLRSRDPAVELRRNREPDELERLVLAKLRLKGLKQRARAHHMKAREPVDRSAFLRRFHEAQSGHRA